MFDAAYPHGRHYHWKAHQLGPLTDEIIDVIVDQAAQVTSPLSAVPIFARRCLARVPEESTAFPYRVASRELNIAAWWLPDTLATPIPASQWPGSWHPITSVPGDGGDCGFLAPARGQNL